jgi:hypothetical protein
MAEVAVLYRPGNSSIVARTTILTINDFQHIDFITPGFELEPKICVTDFASKPHAVKPMREYNRAHTLTI